MKNGETEDDGMKYGEAEDDGVMYGEAEDDGVKYGEAGDGDVTKYSDRKRVMVSIMVIETIMV